MQADYLQTIRLSSHWGEPRTLDMYQVDMNVGEERLSAVEVIADKFGSEILLGRNILNKLILLFDGIRLQTDILTRRPIRP